MSERLGEWTAGDRPTLRVLHDSTGERVAASDRVDGFERVGFCYGTAADWAFTANQASWCGHYATREEAEQAAEAELVRAGWLPRSGGGA